MNKSTSIAYDADTIDMYLSIGRHPNHHTFIFILTIVNQKSVFMMKYYHPQQKNRSYRGTSMHF